MFSAGRAENIPGVVSLSFKDVFKERIKYSMLSVMMPFLQYLGSRAGLFRENLKRNKCTPFYI